MNGISPFYFWVIIRIFYIIDHQEKLKNEGFLLILFFFSLVFLINIFLFYNLILDLFFIGLSHFHNTDHEFDKLIRFT